MLKLNHNEKKTKGFTLIEVMIAIAIIGILASVAYPSYTEHVKRSNRSEGQRELLRIANLMEQRFLDVRAYTDNMTELGLNADPYITIDGGKYYSIDATVPANGDSFLLTATARGSQSSDTHCTAFSITETGQRTATNADCWEN